MTNIPLNQAPTSGCQIRPGLKAATPIIFAAVILMSSTVTARPSAGLPEWRPESSEKLVKLPATYLKKSIDSDFADSKLGLAIEENQEKSRLKLQSLKDLKMAVRDADGEVKTEIRHHLLAEKRSFIYIMSNKNEMRRKQLVTKLRLFERMLKKLGESDAQMTKSREKLVDKQEAAKKRFHASLSTVDVRLFENDAIPESKYSQKYAKNMTAIGKLVSRIGSHRMNSSINADGHLLTKEEYIRGLLAETQSEISILEQEETILGYMAKLVALDALVLSEEALDAVLINSDLPVNSGPAEAADFFLSN